MNRPSVQPRAGVRVAHPAPKKKRFPWKLLYWGVLALLLIATVITVVTLLGKLKNFLTEYESVQPKYLADEVFASYFSPFSYETLKAAGAGDTKLTPFESEENIRDYVAKLIEGKELSYHLAATGTTDRTVSALKLTDLSRYFIETFNAKGALRYTVMAGENKLAEFTLDHAEGADAVSPRGFIRYALSSVSLYYYPHESIAVKIPTTFTAYINGVAPDDSYRVAGSEETTEHENHLPAGVEGITYVGYAVKGLYETPALTVKNNFGADCAVSYVEDGNYYTCDIYDAALDKEYRETVIRAVEGYSAYIQESTVKTATIRDYFDTDTQLWQSILDNPYYFVGDHTGWFFVNQTAGEFYRYSDDVFSCRVAMDHHLTLAGAEDFVDHVDLTLYLHRCADGVFRIYDCFAN